MAADAGAGADDGGDQRYLIVVIRAVRVGVNAGEGANDGSLADGDAAAIVQEGALADGDAVADGDVVAVGEVDAVVDLHSGAEVLVYPTAIGSEPDHPGFDTEPLWQQVIVGNGVANGTFMVAVNRIGTEGPITFYGSSFISDPYGRILVQAPRDEPAVLVADLDLDQRQDWLELFPFLRTRRPDAYGSLSEPASSPG